MVRRTFMAVGGPCGSGAKSVLLAGGLIKGFTKHSPTITKHNPLLLNTVHKRVYEARVLRCSDNYCRIGF
jgi:hypothetical protein